MSKEGRRELTTVALNSYEEGKKIKISPAGEFRGMDGRLYSLDESAIIKTKEQGIDIPLNVEHGFTTHYDARAVGWVSLDSLETQDGGIYGILTLNEEGKKLVDDKSYRYLSPEFTINQKREVLTLDGIALTNTPNLKLEINHKKEKELEIKDKTKELNEKLEAMTASMTAKDQQIETLTTALKEQTFNAALAAGKALPKDKEFAMSLNTEQLNSWVDSLAVGAHAQQIDPEQEKNEKEKAFKEDASKLGWEV